MRTPWWFCAACGFANKPRPVTNSLGTVPADHTLFNREWREAHCEQCGAQRDETSQEYVP